MVDKINCSAIEAVLPLHRSDYERFALLRLTLDRFWSGGIIHVIVRPEDVNSTAAILDNGRRFHLVNENLLIGSAAAALRELTRHSSVFGFGSAGWLIQQILKLAASSMVQSDFYLTLDADCLLVRAVSRQALVRNNRGLVEYGKPNQRIAWYKASSHILGLPPTVPERNVSVTPFVLHTSTARALTERLAKLANVRNSTSWQQMLLRRRGWTEYSLYHLFAITEGSWNIYHDVEHSRLIGPSIWFKDDKTKWDPCKVFEGERPYYFAVVQSNTNIDADWVRSHIAPYLL